MRLQESGLPSFFFCIAQWKTVKKTRAFESHAVNHRDRGLGMGKGRLTSSDRACAVSSRIAADRSRVCAWRERDEGGGDRVTPNGGQGQHVRRLPSFQIATGREEQGSDYM